MPAASEKLSLADAASRLLDECRMVLPGIQALFGFQLIAVFSDRFATILTPRQQQMHLAAIALVTLAIALIMTPAAYHRQTSPERITERFVRLSTRLLLLSMLPLALAISAEVYIVAFVIAGAIAAQTLALSALAVFVLCWLALPRVWRPRA